MRRRLIKRRSIIRISLTSTWMFLTSCPMTYQVIMPTMWAIPLPSIPWIRVCNSIHWFSFSFVSLLLTDVDIVSTSDGKQAEWMDTKLGSDSRRGITNKFALYHVGLYPSVRDPNEEIHTRLRKDWIPLFDKFVVFFSTHALILPTHFLLDLRAYYILFPFLKMRQEYPLL